jgi:hypothetical protein
MKRTHGSMLLVLSLGGLLGVAGRVAPCNSADGADFCGLERAEDVAFLPGTGWFAVSNASATAPLVLIEARSRQRVAIAAPFAPPAPDAAGARAGGDAPPREVGATDCPGPPAQFRAGGNDVRRIGGALRLVVLNKPEPAPPPAATPDRIEFLSIEFARGIPRARWLGCLVVPAAWSLNDIALATDGTVYGSHQFDRPASAGAAAVTRQRWLDGSPTGHAVQWQRSTGWTRVPDTEVSFANGIAVSRDERLLAVAGTYSKALVLRDRRSGRTRRVTLPHTPDNVTALADGSFLSAGHTGVPVTGVDPCRPAAAVPCGFPFSIVHVTAGRDGDADRTRVLFEHDGSRIPGASVAAPHGERLYLGSFFGDRVTVVDAPAGAPRE